MMNPDFFSSVASHCCLLPLAWLAVKEAVWKVFALAWNPFWQPPTRVVLPQTILMPVPWSVEMKDYRVAL